MFALCLMLAMTHYIQNYAGMHSYKVVENVVATCTLLQQAYTSTMHAYIVIQSDLS